MRRGLGGSVDELPSASEEGLEMGCLRVWERAGLGPEGEGEEGDGVGIDGIGLGQPTGGASEVPDLPGVHYCSRYLKKATLHGASRGHRSSMTMRVTLRSLANWGSL